MSENQTAGPDDRLEAQALARLATVRRMEAQRLRRLSVEADTQAARLEAMVGLVPPVRDLVGDPKV